MAAELKIIVTGAEAAYKQLAGLEAAYERLAEKAIVSQKQASQARVAAVKAEVDKIKAEYKSIGDPLSPGGRGSHTSGSAAPAGMSGGSLVAAGLAVGALTKALDMAVDGLKAFAGFLVSDVVKPQMELERFATQLENSTRGQVKSTVIMDKANAAQLKWNIDANKAAEAIGALQDATGRADLSLGTLDDLAMLSKAYRAELGDLTKYTAAVANLDPTMGADAVLNVVKQSLAGGMEEGGKFTLKEIARTGGALFTNAAALAGTGAQRAASLGAFVQTSGTTGKLDESVTNVNAFISQIQALAKKGTLKGSEVLSADGKQVVLDKAMAAVLTKTVDKATGQASASKLAGLGLSETSAKAINPYFDAFAAALKKNGGNATLAAEEALAGYRRIRDASISEAEIKDAAAKNMATSAEKWDSAVNKIKGRLLAVMPQVQSLIDQIAEADIGGALATLADVVLDVVGWLADQFSGSETKEKVKNLRASRAYEADIARAESRGDLETAGKLKADRARASALAATKTDAASSLAKMRSTNALYDVLGLGDLKYREGREAEKDVVRSRLAGYVAQVQAKAPSQPEAENYIQEQVKTGMITEEQANVLRDVAEKARGAMETHDAAVRKTADEMDKLAEAARDLALGFGKIPTGPMGGGGNGGKK